MLQVELANAKKNNDDLSVQVKEGFEAKRAHGQYPGPAPLGYVNAIVGPGMRNIVPDHESSPKVVELFKSAASGRFNLHDLWMETQKIGLRSKRGRLLGKQTLVELLKRRAYTGVFKYGGEECHQGTYTPLISADLFDQVQIAMGWVKKHDRPKATSGRDYPYKGILLCQTCRFNITAYTKSKKLVGGRIAEYSYYTCTKKNRLIKCAEPEVADHILKEEILTEVSKFEISQEDAHKCLGYIKHFYDEFVDGRSRYRTIWLEDQKEAKKALDLLDDRLERGVITEDRYKARVAKHQDTLARTSSRVTFGSGEHWRGV